MYLLFFCVLENFRGSLWKLAPRGIFGVNHESDIIFSIGTESRLTGPFEFSKILGLSKILRALNSHISVNKEESETGSKAFLQTILSCIRIFGPEN